MDATPAFLLDHPELVTPAAPWCVRVDNLELGALLLTQPWLVGAGLRRAELARQLERLRADLPFGAIYFQRVKRAVARLVSIDAMEATGTGRSLRFAATPRGFATLILNLQVLAADPTIDGSELELKRALVSMWNLVLERLRELPSAAIPAPGPDAGRFFEQVERLEVLGASVITDAAIERAFDVQRLIGTQRRQVEGLLAATRDELAARAAGDRPLSTVDLSRLVPDGIDDVALLAAHQHGALAVIRSLAAGDLPRVGLEAQALRYRRCLDYLDDLAALYAGTLKTVDLGSLRGMLGGRRPA